MRRSRWITAGLIAVGLVGGGAGIAIASSQGASGDDDGTERPITGSALAKAQDVALSHTGGGRVTATEIGDEEGYYEVEVTMSDGRQVDVRLDEKFTVIGSEGDTDGGDRGDDTGNR